MARSSVVITGNHSQLFDKSYDKIMYDEYKRYDPLFTKIFNMKTSSQHSEKRGELAPIGAMQEMYEGQPVTQDVPVQGNDKEIFFPKYGIAVPITDIARDDDRSGYLKQMFPEIGKSAAYTRELLAWDVLNNGFVSTYRETMNGDPLIDDSHDLVNSSETIDNEGSGALSLTTYEAALQYFRLTKNHSGIPTYYEPKHLVIHPANEWVAKELQLSEFKPYTANNEINPVKDAGLDYILSPYLTSTTAWFVVASESPLDFWTRMPLKTKSYVDNPTDSLIYQASMRIAADFWEPFGIYGSLGT